MGLTVDLERARTDCDQTIEAFVRAAGSLDEHELLGASRCHGWTRLDVVVHVIAGWQEMLGGLVCRTAEPPTVDAASYWTAFAEEYGSEDAVAALMSQRRRTAAYARPGAATAQLRDVATALARGVRGCTEERREWQGHVFAAGDFLAIWAVENVVHHLDLLTEVPAPAGALNLARRTVEELAGGALPSAWSDLDAVLAGAGRAPAPWCEDDAIASRLPVLG
ncbi:maleylpyruvate isomerase N-terminal domain-containing protein [Nocardioides nanhaiensis]|uniref:Maleylpyruvate isomerase N-terminal domain-containing protein n=1 Tax=Nocardioides nanhaiensis TaxID=1476871 RepID=A0ABP8WNJ8_9ACTN